MTNPLEKLFNPLQKNKETDKTVFLINDKYFTEMVAGSRAVRPSTNFEINRAREQGKIELVNTPEEKEKNKNEGKDNMTEGGMTEEEFIDKTQKITKKVTKLSDENQAKRQLEQEEKLEKEINEKKD